MYIYKLAHYVVGILLNDESVEAGSPLVVQEGQQVTVKSRVTNNAGSDAYVLSCVIYFSVSQNVCFSGPALPLTAVTSNENKSISGS